MKDKVKDLVPKSGNLAGNIYSNPTSPSMSKATMTEVPKKKLSDETAKANATAQHGKGSFNGAQKTGSGVRAD